MTWSYSVSDLATSPKDQVRLMIGDTVPSDPQLQDEEIAQIALTRGTIYGAAAECCRSIASKFSRSVTQKTGTSQVNFSDMAKAYLKLAFDFDQKAARAGAALPYAGGISAADKATQEQDPDRVTPQFNIGMEDNLLDPIGPVGNETQDAMQTAGGG